MTTFVAALVLVSALAHAAWNAMLKGRQSEPLSATAGLAVVWVVGGLPFALWFPAPSVASWPHLGASIAIHLGYLALLVAAYEKGDLSVVYPIARGLPPVLVAGAAWLVVGERLSPSGLVGLTLVASGVFYLGFDAVSGQSGTRRRASVALALVTALFIAGYTMVDGVGVRLSDSPFGYVMWLMTGEGALFALYAFARGGRPLAARVWAGRRAAIVAGVLSAGGYAVALWAMNQAPIALVAALRETSVVFAAVLGTLVLGEPFGRRRIIAAALVAAGIAAIRM
jgi:drug/metabolite transporter (DMT)-like permease